MQEIWKDIKDYEGRYQVSNFGNIKSLKTNKLLKPYKITNGYLQIVLCKKGKEEKRLIHILVAEAFIGKRKRGMQINHKDENKTNNNVNNLEWCNAKYNSNYGTRNKRISTRVLCVELNKIYDSIREASKELKIYETSISHCCSNSEHYKTAGGYHWRYV